jgi:hypothetical protein
MLCMIRTLYVVKELVLISISDISVTIVLLSFVSLTVVRYFFLSSLKLKLYPTLETRNVCLLKIRVRNVLIETEIAIKVNSMSCRICGKSKKLYFHPGEIAFWVMTPHTLVDRYHCLGLSFCLHICTLGKSGIGGLEVACWPLVPKFAGSHPAEAVGFLGLKNLHAFPRRGSKAVGLMS